TDPDTVWAKLQQEELPQISYVVVTHDRGETWHAALDTLQQINGIVVSDDGNTVWAGTSTTLFWSNDGGTLTALPVPQGLSCVSRYGSRLYSCGWFERDGFAVARDTGDGLKPLLTWPQVTGVAKCPASSVVSTLCAGFYPALVAQFPVSPDAGMAGGTGGGAGGTGGGGGRETPTPSCGCSAGGAELSLTLWLALGRFAAAHALRRRRVHR
ncbi:MAG: hypothetical protein JNK82_02570, partial [Myxococcaceae bacterium]|nr:hypothetical protein [Myxococcaceae bacterium]